MNLEREEIERFLFQRLTGEYKPLVILLVVVLLIGGAFAYHDYLGSFYHVVNINGEPAGAVRDPVEIGDYIMELRESARNNFDMEVLGSKVISSYYDQDKSLKDDPETVKKKLREYQSLEIASKLKERQPTEVEAYQMVINNKDTFVLETKADYEKVLELVKEKHVRDGTEVLDVFIEDDITYKKITIDPNRIHNPEDVAEQLVKVRNRRQEYLVSRGDSLWSIARRQDSSVEELKEANPQLEGDILTIGEALNLDVPETLVDVVVKLEVSEEEKVPYETNYSYDSSMWRNQSEVVKSGEYGEKLVTYEVSLKNGVEIEREYLKEEVVKEPVSREVVKGTATPTASGVVGTGNFIWPAASGRITSYFGPRGRGFHNGIDIASSRGTPIYAADSGVVTFSGYRGAYGRLIILDHGNGYTTYYAHNSSNLISTGEQVKQGQTIAYMGVTGNATGSHLHFEIRRNGSPINPMNYYSRN